LTVNVGTDYSRSVQRDMVDSIAERDLGYPVQSSDSTEVKQMHFSKTENQVAIGALDSGFSR